MAKIIMNQLDYEKTLRLLMRPEIMTAIDEVRECRGRKALYQPMAPEKLAQLREVAKIQSTGASNGKGWNGMNINSIKISGVSKVPTKKCDF